MTTIVYSGFSFWVSEFSGLNTNVWHTFERFMGKNNFARQRMFANKLGVFLVLLFIWQFFRHSSRCHTCCMSILILSGIESIQSIALYLISKTVTSWVVLDSSYHILLQEKQKAARDTAE